MTPPPKTSRRWGRRSRSKSCSLVIACSRSPGMGGMAARAPVATKALVKRKVWPPTWTVSCPEKRAAPRNTSMPAWLSRPGASWGLMSARSFRMRSMTWPKSTCTAPVLMPSACSSRACCAAWATLSRALLGTQPLFRQSPPKRCFSTSATRAPKPAAPRAAIKPAGPPPMTTRL